MSGTTAPTGPLTDAETTDARRFLGYSLYGLGVADPTFNRYNPVNITLEYRLANMSDAELLVTRNFLATLATLETAIPAASDNLVADQAASYRHNKNELKDRVGLYDYSRRQFADFLGIPCGPGVSGNGGSVRLVV